MIIFTIAVVALALAIVCGGSLVLMAVLSFAYWGDYFIFNITEWDGLSRLLFLAWSLFWAAAIGSAWKDEWKGRKENEDGE